ncbi:MFS transporter [Leucobacter soli]|uniref:hypothetical protein n=1 Tax=Leucobacter soli TaxID=2812850 RepID=UPI00361D2141
MSDPSAATDPAHGDPARAGAASTGSAGEKRSWTPMVGLFLAQVLMSFNVAALPISLGGMVQDFGVPPTVASTTIVVYGLAVAALVMTGAKLGQRVGWVLIFRVVVAIFAVSSLMMIFSPPSPGPSSARCSPEPPPRSSCRRSSRSSPRTTAAISRPPRSARSGRLAPSRG